MFMVLSSWQNDCKSLSLECRTRQEGYQLLRCHKQGAHLPVYGSEAHRWIDHWLSDARPVQRQTYNYLPSRRTSPPFDGYQIILLGEQRHMCVNKLPKVAHLAVHWMGVKPATSGLQVLHVTVTPPNQLHCVSKKCHTWYCPYICRLLTDFQNSFTGTLYIQLAIKSLLSIPSHCIATLPCETQIVKNN